MSSRAEGPYVSPEFDRPRRKRSEYDPPRWASGTSSSDALRELYATDPTDAGDDALDPGDNW